MRRGLAHWTGIGVLALSLFCQNAYAGEQSPEQRLRAALGRLNQWLEQGNVAEAWRKVVPLERLDQELAKAPDADRAALIEVLGRLGRDDPGLQLEPFVRLRQAVQAWLASLPPPPADQLPAAVRAAKSVFVSRTPVDLQDAKAELAAALDRLDAALQTPAPKERDWKALLQPAAIREQLARKEGPELTALDAAYLRFLSGYEGLGRVCFRDVRDNLYNYLVTARAIGDAKVRKQYEAVLEGLADRLEKYRKTPSGELAEEIDQLMDWLDQAGQAGWIVKAVRQQMSHPNIFVEVSGGLVSARVAGPVDETGPVRECILKTDIHATGRTVGELKVEMVPSSDSGQMDLMFEGATETDSVGYRGKLRVFANGVTRLSARKRVSLDAEKITAGGTQSCAETDTTINGICATNGSCLLERVASRRAEKQKGEAECIASQRAEVRFNEQMDERAAKLVAQANERYSEKLRRPLVERRLFPESVRLHTTDRALGITAMPILEGSLAAPGAPPKSPEAADLAVRIHQTAINNLTFSALGGMMLDENRFQEILESLGTPKPGPDEDDGENWEITFARRQPITVAFAKDSFSVTIRGRAFGNGRQHYANPMNVTATYKIERADRGGWKAVRQGDLVVVPPGFKLGGGKQLSAREQTLRKVLERRLAKFFKAELAPKNLVMKEEGRAPVELQLSRWEADNGWLVLAWKQVPASSPTTAATKAHPETPGSS